MRSAAAAMLRERILLSLSIESTPIPASKPNTRDTTSPIVIAHDKDVQALLDHYRIAKGVQFEIARGVTEGRWKWSDITKSVLRDLRGTNFEAGSKLSEAIGKGSEIPSPIVLAARRNIL